MSSAIERVEGVEGVEGAEGTEGVSIETYLNSLSNEIVTLDVSYKGITSLPDLTRFKNLKKLICYKNNLTCLPLLPQNLQELYCSHNKLTCLPTLPPNLKELDCSYNQLTCLHPLPQNLQEFSCSKNKLTCLPTLPPNLKELDCFSNKLTCLPTLPPNLQTLYCYDIPIWEIVNSNSLFQIKKNIQILNNLRDLYYCLKFKKQLRKWLWEKVREKRAMEMYNPNYLVENLSDEEDLEKVLENWN
jgi:Leucine-rich repeat (LRR) protein